MRSSRYTFPDARIRRCHERRAVTTQAVFLDRDGDDSRPGYLCRIDELRWYPAWTIDAVRLLKRAGFLVFMTTNQGASRSAAERFVHQVHEAMSAR